MQCAFKSEKTHNIGNISEQKALNQIYY